MCTAGEELWAGLRVLDQPSWLLLSHSCSKFDSALPSPENTNLCGTCGIRLAPGSPGTMARGTRVPTQLCTSPPQQLSLLLPRPPRLLGKDRFSAGTELSACGPGSIRGSKVFLNYGQAAITRPRARLRYTDTCVQRCCCGRCWHSFALAAASTEAPVSGNALNQVSQPICGTLEENQNFFETSPEMHREAACIYRASAFP